MRTEALRVRALSKKTENKTPLEEVNFHVFAGEKVGIIGLQNSGKGTLVDILCGIQSRDGGSVLVEDKEVFPVGIYGAMRDGIYRISSQTSVVSSMTVAEYLFAPSKYYLYDSKKQNAVAHEILASFKIDIQEKIKMGTLTLSQQRIIEFVRTILQRPKIIIFDGVREIGLQNGNVIRTLSEKALHLGIGILVIGNHADELMLSCDRVYPLYAGTLGHPIEKSRLSKAVLFKAITGEDVEQPVLHPNSSKTGDVVFETVSLRKQSGGEAYSFRLCSGEISAMIVSEIEEAVDISKILTGGGEYEGQILLSGKPVHFHGIDEAIRNGVCLITDDVEKWGLFPHMSIAENITLLARTRRYRALEPMTKKSEEYLAKECADYVGFSGHELNRMVAEEKMTYSEKQKILLARYAALHPKVYIFNNPLEKNDEVSAPAVIELIRKLAQGGAGVLIFSTSTERLRSFCDEIHYFF